MTWEQTNQNRTVIVKKEGQDLRYDYPQNTQLGVAVRGAAERAGLSGFIVKCDGNEVQPEASNTPLGEYQTIEVFPKFSGAW